MSLSASAGRLMAAGLSSLLARILTGGDASVQGVSLQIGAGEFLYESVADNLSAHAGGGQASATPMTAMMNRVTTVATIADSVSLPPSVNGMQVVTVNAAANSMNVFPATGEQINALGANSAFAVAGGKTAMFSCVTAGQWHSILSA